MSNGKVHSGSHGSESEAADYVPLWSGGRAEGRMPGLGLPFFVVVVPSGTRAHGKTHPLSGWVFLPQLNLSGNTLTDTPRGAFPW